MNGIVRHLVLNVWLLSGSTMFSRFVYVVARACAPFLFSAVYYSIAWAYHIVYLFICWTFGLFTLLDIINNAAVNICVRVVEWTRVFIDLGGLPRSEIAWPNGTSVSNSARLFSKGATPFHQQCMKSILRRDPC